MNINQIITWKCPTCSFENKMFVDANTPPSNIEYCNAEDGGCDTRHVVDISLTLTAKAFIIQEIKP